MNGRRPPEREKKIRRALPPWVGRKLAVALISLLAGFLAWQVLATQFHRTVFPSPLDVVRVGEQMIGDGSLFGHIGISLYRMALGFLIGCLIAIPTGVLMGVNDFFRRTLEPFINLFRFIPAISFVVFSIVWFGIGESSKIFLILYNAFFTVTVNTEAGVRGIPLNRIRAAQSLGGRGYQIFFQVLLPSTVPYVFAGMRIAMGRSFSTIVAAEMLAASAGVGYLIFSSREFMRTDIIFLALFILGLMGFLADRAMRLLMRRFGREYVPAEGE
ncbi:MAG: ABC transporter permease [Deltaproteobacteria bacterium]|nr:ABC transporter permease [Deltaproteobacteria bacterium]